MGLGNDDPRPLFRRSQESADDLIDQFRTLLTSALPEQSYQDFLEQHTQLVPREFEQNHGIHFDLVVRKLPFGSDFVSDFFFLSKSSDDWNCVFIELESPNAPLFKKKSNDISKELNAGINQIDHWRAWLSSEANRTHFIDHTVGFLRHPFGRNPCYMKFILVIGRRSEYEENELRRANVRAKERDDFKIITYDSLMESLDTKFPLFVGVRTKMGIDLLSDRLMGTNIFSWLSPELIGVRSPLLEQIKSHRSNHFRLRTSEGGPNEAFRYAEDKLRVLRD